MKRKANYTKEFKVKACELVLKDGVKVKHSCGNCFYACKFKGSFSSVSRYHFISVLNRSDKNRLD